MKGIIIRTDCYMSVHDFGEPLYKTVGAVVGGYIEHVKPGRLPEPFCMIVNEEGLLKGLDLNPFGSWLYCTDLHGSPIAGDIVIMRDGIRNGEHDIVGLTDTEVSGLLAICRACGLAFATGETKKGDRNG